MPCKVTFFYNLGAGGFSETYWHASNDPITLALTTPNSLYQAGANFRHSSCILRAARFSKFQPPNQPPVVKLSQLIRPFPTAQGTSGTTAEPGPDVISTTAVYKLSSGNGATRRVFVRGLADIDTRRDIFGNDAESPALRTGRTNFFIELMANGFTIRTTDRPPFGGLVFQRVQRVSSMVPPDASRVQFFLFPNAPVHNVGDKLSVTGIPRELPGFPRTIEILAASTVDAVTTYVGAYRLPGGVSVSPKNMRVSTLSYTLSPIAFQGFERFSEHKTGRPFGLLRGRSRGAARVS